MRFHSQLILYFIIQCLRYIYNRVAVFFCQPEETPLNEALVEVNRVFRGLTKCTITVSKVIISLIIQHKNDKY